MSGKWTRGPWVLDDHELGPIIRIRGDETLMPVATFPVPGIYTTAETLAERRANEKLFAAAPDLVLALKRLVCTPGSEMRAEYDQAIAALRKAGALD